MSTADLILKLVECLIVISAEHLTNKPGKAEAMLRRLQLLWIQERPLVYHSEN